MEEKLIGFFGGRLSIITGNFNVDALGHNLIFYDVKAMDNIISDHDRV